MGVGGLGPEQGAGRQTGAVRLARLAVPADAISQRRDSVSQSECAACAGTIRANAIRVAGTIAVSANALCLNSIDSKIAYRSEIDVAKAGYADFRCRRRGGANSDQKDYGAVAERQAPVATDIGRARGPALAKD